MHVEYCQQQFPDGYTLRRARMISQTEGIHEAVQVMADDELREIGAADASGGCRMVRVLRSTREAIVQPILCQCGAPIRRVLAPKEALVTIAPGSFSDAAGRLDFEAFLPLTQSRALRS